MALASLAERARCVWLPFPLLTRALQTILLASAFPPLKDEKPSSAGASSGAAADVSTGGAQVDATSQTNTSTTNLGYAAALLKKAAKVAEEAKVEAVGAVAAGPAESGAVAASERVAEEGEEKTEEKKKKGPEPKSFEIQNPSRITKAQKCFVSVVPGRYHPILPKAVSGIIMLSDKTPDDKDEEVVEVKAPSVEEPEAPMPEPFVWSPELVIIAEAAAVAEAAPASS